MITDKQGREWVLKKLYDQGFKYLYFNEYFNKPCISDTPPEVNAEGKLWTSPNNKLEFFASLKYIITIDKPYIDIEKELGIVDWSKVPVDTPIVVWDNGDFTKEKRHFAKYQNGRLYAFGNGQTSWTTSDDDIATWDNARLLHVDNE